MKRLTVYFKSHLPTTYVLLFFIVGMSCSANQKDKHLTATNEVVEYLVFEVKEGRVEEFIALDQKIWTTHLEEHDGFIAKEIWIDKFKPTEVTAIIYWNSMEQWKSIPQEELSKIIEEFDTAFGKDDYKLVDEVHGRKRLYKVLDYR